MFTKWLQNDSRPPQQGEGRAKATHYIFHMAQPSDKQPPQLGEGQTKATYVPQGTAIRQATSTTRGGPNQSDKAQPADKQPPQLGEGQTNTAH